MYDIFKNTFFTEHLQWLLLTVSGFQVVTLLKKKLWQRCFSVSFSKLLGTSCDRMFADDCFLCLSVILFICDSQHLFYRWPLGNCLFQVNVAEFQPADTVKNDFTGAFQVFFKRTRSSLSKTYTWKLSIKKFIRNEVARC